MFRLLKRLSRYFVASRFESMAHTFGNDFFFADGFHAQFIIRIRWGKIITSDNQTDMHNDIRGMDG